jgi:hypothetical protein
MHTSARKRRLPLGVVLAATLALPAAARSEGVDREDSVEPLAGDVRVLDNGLLVQPSFPTPSNAELSTSPAWIWG